MPPGACDRYLFEFNKKTTWFPKSPYPTQCLVGVTPQNIETFESNTNARAMSTRPIKYERGASDIYYQFRIEDNYGQVDDLSYLNQTHGNLNSVTKMVNK